MAHRKTSVGMMLKSGHWFMWPIDQQLPNTVKIFKGGVHEKKEVMTIPLQSALAFIRYYAHPGLYYSYMDYSGKWHDVRVCGDIGAWYGDEWLLTQSHDKDEEK